MTDLWNKYKKEMKMRRSKDSANKAPKVNFSQILEKKCITVQRCSPEVSGKAQKYSKIGAREFVPYLFDDVSIENMKMACNNHFGFKDQALTCDVLAGDQGPSCSLLNQLPNLKVVYIRAVPKDVQISCNEVLQSASSTSMLPSIKRKKISGQNEAVSETMHPIPKSLSVLEIMKLGCAIEATSTRIKLSEFNISNFMWSTEKEVDIHVEKNSFSEGGFRKAFKARSTSNMLPGTWVLKKYLPTTMKAIKETNQTPQMHTRKIVQSHVLAANFAAQMAKAAKSLPTDEFGYVPNDTIIYFGKIEEESEEFVTLEEYICDTFKKYTSNDGTVSGDKTTIPCQKACCLVHYSYQHSGQQVLLTDIQGGMFVYTDPEIASLEHTDETGAFLFCAGNLSQIAITNFVSQHECNKFCKLLSLQEMA